jgi:hypothetical protein
MQTREEVSCKTLTFGSFLLHHMLKKCDGQFGILAPALATFCFSPDRDSFAEKIEGSLSEKI